MTRGKRRIFYGYYMLATCLVMLIVGTGIVNNCAGQFITPVCDELGLPRSSMTLYLSFQNTALMIFVPFLGVIYKKIKPKLFTITGAAVMILSFAALSQCREAWQFWICGFVIGAGLATVSTSTVSMLMNNWFIKNKGLVIGIAMAGSGFGSMIFNPLGQNLIATYGYQTAYLMLAAIIFVVFIPVMIVYRFKPEDIGLKPLGYDEQASASGSNANEVVRTGTSYKEAIRSPKFYLLAFIVLCLSGCGQGTFTHLQAYFTGVGFDPMFAASIIGITSAFLMVGKVVWGRVRDQFGPRPTLIVALSFFVLSYVLVLLVPLNTALCYVYAAVFGLAYATPTVFSPLLTIASFGEKEFSSIYGSVQIFFYLGPIIANPLSGAIFDRTGAYSIAWIVYGIAIFICLIAGSIMLSGKDKNKATA